MHWKFYICSCQRQVSGDEEDLSKLGNVCGHCLGLIFTPGKTQAFSSISCYCLWEYLKRSYSLIVPPAIPSGPSEALFLSSQQLIWTSIWSTVAALACTGCPKFKERKRAEKRSFGKVSTVHDVLHYLMCSIFTGCHLSALKVIRFLRARRFLGIS